ncbi:MAG: MGMT family protein [Desulfobacterales bacterium]|nr:MGMT family protein [Desulfobacterales bacterium]
MTQKKVPKPNKFEQVYQLTEKVPAGKVTTYGRISRMIDRCTPRMVGFAMAALPFDSDIPWQRVINSQGKISIRPGSDAADIQRAILEDEGVIFDKNGRVDLGVFEWTFI